MGRRKQGSRAVEDKDKHSNNISPTTVVDASPFNASIENVRAVEELEQAKLKIHQLQAEKEQLNSKFKGTLGVVNDRLKAFHCDFTKHNAEMRKAFLESSTRLDEDFTKEYEDLKKTLFDILNAEVPSTSSESASTTESTEQSDKKFLNENDEGGNENDESEIESKSSDEMDSTHLSAIEQAMEKLHNGEPEPDGEEKVEKDDEKVENENENIDIVQKALSSVFEAKYDMVQQDPDSIMIFNDQDPDSSSDQEKEIFVSQPDTQMINSEDLDKNEGEEKNDEKMEVDENKTTTTSDITSPAIKKGTKRAFTMRIAVRKPDKDIIAEYDNDSSSNKDSDSSESDREEIEGIKKKVKLDNLSNTTSKPGRGRKPKAVPKKSKSVPSEVLRRGRSRNTANARGRQTKSTKTKGSEQKQSTKSGMMQISEKSLRNEKKALEDMTNDSTPRNEIIMEKKVMITLLNISPYISPNGSRFNVVGKLLENLENCIQKKEIQCRSDQIKKQNLTLIQSDTPTSSSKSRGRPKSATKVFNNLANKNDSDADAEGGETPRLKKFGKRNTRQQQRKLELSISKSAGDIPCITIHEIEDDEENDEIEDTPSEVDSQASTEVSTVRSTSTSLKDFDENSDNEEPEISRAETEENRKQRIEENILKRIENSPYNFEGETTEYENYLILNDVFFGQNDGDDLQTSQNTSLSLSTPTAEDEFQLQLQVNDEDIEMETTATVGLDLDLGDYNDDPLGDFDENGDPIVENVIEINGNIINFDIADLTNAIVKNVADQLIDEAETECM